jgi:HlyD family secretion protein
MSKTTKRIIWGAAGLVLLLIIVKIIGNKNKDIKVTAEKVQKRTITEIVNGSGKVYPVVEVKVSSDNSGEITELDVKEGDTVKVGQVVARIYADIYALQRDQASSGVAQSQAQVANAQAAIDALKAMEDQADSAYAREKKLYDQQVVSKSEFETAVANLKSAQANYNAGVQSMHSGEAGFESAKQNLEKANKDLSRTTITAPMNGVVTLLNVKKGEKIVGNNLMAGTELLRIADLSQIEVRVDVNESDVPKVKVGDSALVDIDAYPTHKFRGIVTQISSSNNGAATENEEANASTDVTNYKVFVRLLPADYINLVGKGVFPFRPGMNASADIQTQTDANVLSVPINAVTTRSKNDSVKTNNPDNVINTTASADDDLDEVVFVLDSATNRIKKVKVQTSIQDINYMEITDGLQEGQQIITGPYDVVSKQLKDGDKVKVLDKKDLKDLFDQK